jgi:type I restriction enzyme S subunit
MSEPILRPLTELCSRSIAQTDPKRNPDREFWYVDISAVDNVGKRITSPQRIKGKDASVRARQLIQTHDVLVATTRPNLNAVALVPEEYDGEVCSTGFCVLRAGKELDPEYLFQAVQSRAFIEPLIDLTKGALYPAVTDKQVFVQLIPWIPVVEQRQIAARLKAQLAEVETARQAAQAQLREAENLRMAVYRKAFHGICPVSAPPLVGAVPYGWQWRKLTGIARLESGHTPSRLRPDWWGGDVSWVSLTEIRALDGTWVESTQLRTNEAGIANSAARILPRGTVCFSRTASVGFVTIMAQPMATSQDFANWVCSDELEPEFLMYALIRSRKELRDLATGATHKTIYMPTLESFHLCAPSRDEQRRITGHLKSQLAEVTALQQAAAAQLAEIERLPQRILAQAFTDQGAIA